MYNCLTIVLRWHEWGEVENVYIAYNFSNFLIYQPKVIEIDENVTKGLIETILHSFFWDTV